MATNTVRPPGPKGHWLGGNFPEMKRDPLGFVTRCAREHGDVVTLRFGLKKVVLLSHPDLVENVLVTNNRNFTKDFSLRLYSPVIGNGLLTSEGDFWLRQRRLAQPAFQRQRTHAYADVMIQYTERLLAAWSDGITIDLHAHMMRLTLEIAAKTLFDADVTAAAKGVGAALEEALVAIDKRLGYLFWLPVWAPTRNNLRLQRAVKTLDAILYRFINERRASGEDRGDLLSLLLQTRDEDDGGRMTNKQLRDEAMTLFLAGHETTALALSWTWYLLARNPDAEEELEAELAHVLGRRNPTVADLPNLKFTERVVTESLRLYPPAYGMGREAIEDCAIGGFPVPAGTPVYFHQWVIHRDPRFFDDPERFLPNRWAGGLAQRLPRFAYFPFGGGPRLCIGNAFAMMEAMLVLATVARHYRFRLDPTHQEGMWPSITLRPRHGIRMILKKRN